ncbi:hypothetical protein M513_10377 [Trichuris suis]|uniref:SRR1-like domain-containing protein n=1 Tax=Trichuris suis TaxID=68888 RepID=A0A085LUV1_9BILA|nr:hypothetical protein M513_10377 [Trichuris suis]
MDADGFVKVQRRKNHKRALKHSIRSCNPSACFSSDYLVKIGNWESRFCKFTEELQASRLFARLIYELEAISGNKNESVDLVCYALGNFHSSLPATYQLALIELLRRQSFFSDSTVVYDPVFDEGEKNRLRAVGWHVLDLDEPCYRKVTKPTFFFMPCCPLSLLNNVIFANRTGQLGNLILFCVSLKVAVADLSVCMQDDCANICFAADFSREHYIVKDMSFCQAFYCMSLQTLIYCILQPPLLPMRAEAVNHLLNIFRTTTTTLLNRQFCSVETTACLRRTNLLLEARRYLPKPGPNKQYKYDYSVLEGMAYTHKPLRLRRLGGRNPETGRKVNQRVGGGYKFDWFWVLEVRRDANYSPFIALVIGAKGRRWILATEHMTAGDIIRTSCELPKILVHGKEGDSWPVGALMPGTIVNCVELYPNCTDNCIIARNAGTSATILRKAGDFVMIQAPSKREYCIKPQCMATVGRLSNVNRNKEPWGSMNMKRRMGIRMGSGLWHRKDGYCGRKVHPPLPPLTVEGPRPPRPQTNSVTLSKWDHNAIFGNGTTNFLSMDADGFVKVQRRKNHKRALKHSIRSCNPSACFSSDYLVKIGNWESRFCKFTEELQASRLFARLIYELEAISGNKNESVDLVCYALGNFHSSLPATYQLALIELLRRQSFFSDSTVVYDPVFDEGEKNRLRAVGWHVLDLDEPCYRKVTKPTFFFMPCCPLSLLNNVIFANRTGQLGNLILFCVSLKVAVADLSVCMQDDCANICFAADFSREHYIPPLLPMRAEAVNHLLNIFRTTTTTLLNRQFCSVETTACLRRTNLLLEARRYLPKPGPNKQYKYDYSVLEGMAYTHKPLRLRRLGGRNPETGRKVNQRVGGGYKFDWFWVLEVRRDANYSPFIALVIGAKGRRWILATEHMTAGDIIRTSCELPKILVHGKEGDSWPVGALMPGTIVNCVELYPNCTDNCIIARNAGTSATILRKAGDFVMIQAPSKREYCIKPQCMATVGRLSNVNRNKEPWGSMNMKRRMGIRMGSGLWHRKDGYCGRKVHPPLPPLTVEGPRPPRPQTNSVTLSKWDHNAIFGNGTTNFFVNNVRAKRITPGFGWLDPLFMDTDAFPLTFTDMGNVRFWSDGWSLPTSYTYHYKQTANDYYLMDNAFGSLPGLSDNPNILGNDWRHEIFFPPERVIIEMLVLVVCLASFVTSSALLKSDDRNAVARVKRLVPGFGALDPLFMPPLNFYPDPGFVRYWGGGYRPVATGTFYGAPILLRGTSGYLQAALVGPENYMLNQYLSQMHGVLQPEYVK